MENIYQHLHFVKEMYVSFTYFTHWLHARPTTIKPQNTENMVTKGWKVTIDESYREVSKQFLKTVHVSYWHEDHVVSVCVADFIILGEKN